MLMTRWPVKKVVYSIQKMILFMILHLAAPPADHADLGFAVSIQQSYRHLLSRMVNTVWQSGVFWPNFKFFPYPVSPISSIMVQIFRYIKSILSVATI